MFRQIVLMLLSTLALAIPDHSPAIHSCPEIIIDCVTDNYCCGPHFTFVARIQGANPTAKPIYKWEVYAGSIISGQGTSSIRVDSTAFAGQVTTVSVEIDGLEAGCTKLASFTQTICDPLPQSRIFDRYGNLAFRDEKARLANFAIQLQNEPGTSGYIFIYGGSHTAAFIRMRPRNRNA
jgi:hypothetical protein